ncbi:MAG: T9SS type A sorting domain-containing protein [Bacteroidetes bacterium]|nr:T9SS type A sorting domain-containing protein [Bacteroidota bacterium]
MKHTAFYLIIALIFSTVSLWSQNPFQAVNTDIGIGETVQGLTPNGLMDFGTGASVVDLTGDGLEELIIPTGEGEPMLFYTNNGDGTFSDMGNLLPNNFQHQKTALFADLDNDGDQDVFVTSWGGYSRLYENLGNLVYQDITIESGVNRNDAKADGASLGDINNDGYLDIYVCNRDNRVYTNYLYVNQGDNTFLEEAELRGVDDDYQLSHQSIFFDYDNDGDQDLYVVNDRYYRNALFQNDGAGFFTDVSLASGSDIRIDAMNAGVGDPDNDGYLDIYVSNTIDWGGGDRLLHNNGDGTFTEIASDVGANVYPFSWAGLWLDFDNDTDEDLFVVTFKNADPFVWLQNYKVEIGIDVFLNLWPEGLPNAAQTSFSAALLDFNNDGKLDILTPNVDPSPIQIWENVTTNSNNWVKLKFEGVVSNRDAIGTRAEIFIGDKKYIRYLSQGDCYMTQNHRKLHFGLGNATLIDSLSIHWLSGIEETYYDLGVNQTHSFTENASSDFEVALSSSNPLCKGQSDGSILAEGIGGTPPYSVKWSTGSTDFLIEDLPAGRYIATLTDENGNQGIGIADLEDPEALSLQISSLNDPGTGQGQAEVQISGGSPGYVVSWGNGESTASIDGLEEGVYPVDVWDANECSSSAFAVIYDETDPCAACIPTNIEVGANHAIIHWEPVPNSELLRFTIREAGENAWEHLDYSGTEHLYIGNLEAGITYEIRIKTRCMNSIFSSWSDVYAFTTNPEISDCASWEALEYYADNNEAMIQFEDQPGASAYRMRYREEGAGAWQRAVNISSMLTVAQLNPGTLYEYQRSTRCPYDWTPWSESAYFETTGDPFGEETDFRALPNALDKPEFVLYPNPASMEVEVLLNREGAALMVLRDLSGRILLKQSGVGQQEVVDLSQYPPGIYFLSINFLDGSSQNQRLIIQR